MHYLVDENEMKNPLFRDHFAVYTYFSTYSIILFYYMIVQMTSFDLKLFLEGARLECCCCFPLIVNDQSTDRHENNFYEVSELADSHTANYC